MLFNLCFDYLLAFSGTATSTTVRCHRKLKSAIDKEEEAYSAGVLAGIYAKVQNLRCDFKFPLIFLMEGKLDVMKTEPMDMLEPVSLIRQPKWENLESNILLKIVSRVPLNDLCWNVSSACRSWQSACWDLMFWNQDKLDLRVATPRCSTCNMFAAKTTNLYNLGLTPGFSLPKLTNVVDAKLMNLLCSIMEGEDVYGHPLEEWRMSIRKILIPCDLAISDQHLLYIAERAPLATELIIDNASRITPAGFLRALSHWQCIERIHLESVECRCRKEIKELIQENCETIKKLHVSSPINYMDFYEQLSQWA